MNPYGRPPKKPFIIKGIANWKCNICLKIMEESQFIMRKDRHHPGRCRACWRDYYRAKANSGYIKPSRRTTKPKIIIGTIEQESFYALTIEELGL